jgi:uncharacterized protein (DUF1800 family)
MDDHTPHEPAPGELPDEDQAPWSSAPWNAPDATDAPTIPYAPLAAPPRPDTGMQPTGPVRPRSLESQVRAQIANTPTITPTDPAATPPPPTEKRRGVSRRAVLLGAGAGVLGLGALGAGLGYWFSRTSSAGTLPNITGAEQTFHLLRRAGFGARPGEIGTYLQLGINGSIDRLLNPSSVSDDLDSRLSALKLDFTKTLDLQRWFLLRMIYSARPLEEKMTLFWHGYLTSSWRKVGKSPNYPLMIQQNQLLRAHALGKFDDLIHAVTIDPAMMAWLDLRTSTAKSPNENYARELMELFTLGIADSQGNPNYTQDDVVAGAHALTGWALRGGGANGQSLPTQGTFVPSRHDNGSKTLLGHTGNLGLDDVVSIVCAHPATGYHLAWRMWSFFVYENPSTSDLQPLVNAYYQQDHNIGAMVRAMLTSPAFSGAKAYRARVKSPAEFVVGAVRALELTTDARALPPVLDAMGQSIFDPPNVSGWDGDKVSANWMSTQAWMTRVNFIDALLAAASGSLVAKGKHAASGSQSTTSASALQQLITTWKLDTPTALVDYFAASLLDNQITSDRRAAVNAYLAAAPTTGDTLALSGGAKLPAVAARGALYLLMTMPEYHLN